MSREKTEDPFKGPGRCLPDGLDCVYCLIQQMQEQRSVESDDPPHLRLGAEPGRTINRCSVALLSH